MKMVTTRLRVLRKKPKLVVTLIMFPKRLTKQVLLKVLVKKLNIASMIF